MVRRSLGDKKRICIFDIVYERDEANRRYTHVIEGQGAPPEGTVLRLERIVAESSDYASLNEHVITNFTGLVRSINPEYLYLHNLPAHVHLQLQQAFTTEVKLYEYRVCDTGHSLSLP